MPMVHGPHALPHLPLQSPRRVAPLRPPRQDPAWRGRLGMAVLALALLWPALQASEFRPWEMLDAHSLSVAGRFLAGFVPPAHGSDFLLLVAQATWRTVAMATCGVSLALLLALPLALLASSALSISSLGGRMATGPAVLRLAVRTALVVLRTVPELVWALLFVRVVGIGPTAGVLAIALAYAGMLGKVFAEILESSDTVPARVLLGNGSGRLQAFFYGLLPQCAAELTSYLVYRWECAIRSSVVLGFVGAGGLGQRMDESMKMFAGAEVATMLMVFVALVALADALSTALRRNLR